MASRPPRVVPRPPFSLPGWMQALGVICALMVTVAGALSVLSNTNTAYRQSAVQENAYTTAAARVLPLEARVATLETNMATRESTLTARLDTARAVNTQTVSGLTNRLQAVETAQTAAIAQDSQTAAILERLTVQVSELKDRVSDLTRRLFDRPLYPVPPGQRGDADRPALLDRVLPAHGR